MKKHKFPARLIGLTCVFIVCLAGCDTTGPRSDTATTEQHLAELKSRYDKGTLTKEEYERQRAQILSSDTAGQKSKSGPPTVDAVSGILTH
jgi:hypothetical protein